jgi:peptidoglycan/LPS O-acetylase OafA/YrhL
MAHVPALDGLRGVAVAGVLAFHAGHLRGGYLGVDLFFVLSGFLITSLLLAEWDSAGRIDLLAFWGRRFRRLLPALLVVLAAVTLYGALALPVTQLGELRRSGLGTLAYVANWVAIRSGSDYWSAFQAPSLLEHAWSLAIEEQFYVVWPVLAALGLRATRGRRGPLLAATGALALASVAALWLHHAPGGDTARAYYGTDTRAAAILYGAVVALVLAGRTRRSSDRFERVLSALAWPATAVLAAMWATMSGGADALYRWGLPLVGISAALVIAAISGPRAGTLGWGLSAAPLRWLGTISYGLYLWHWPVFVVLDADRLGFGGLRLTAVRLAVSLGLAVVSLRVVEQPVRTGRLPHRQWRMAAPVLMVALGLGVVAGTSGAVELGGSVGDRTTLPADEALAADEGSILLVGDSQALVLALNGPTEVAHRALGGDATLGCGIGPGQAAVDGRALEPDEINHDCAGVVDEWVDRISADRPEVVLLHVGAWDVLDRDIDGRFVPFGTAEWDTLTLANLRGVLDRLGSEGATVVALTAPCFEPEGAGGGPSQRADTARVDHWNALLRQAASASGAQVIDYGRFLCPGGRYQAERDGAALRSDGVHLTQHGAQLAWRWLDGELARVLAGP